MSMTRKQRRRRHGKGTPRIRKGAVGGSYAFRRAPPEELPPREVPKRSRRQIERDDDIDIFRMPRSSFPGFRGFG